MTELGFVHEQTNDKLTAAAERLSQQLGRHSFTGQFDGLKAAEVGGDNPLVAIEQALKEEIIGQPEAIESITSVLRREKIRNPNRPIANLLFLGPTGVGKTETSRELAKQLHGDNGGFIKIDCSNYSYGHTITALIGAPPSYVGREQEAIFASEELEKPRCVVVFDEIEKGSAPLWDLMLQIMDDGEIKLNGTGKTASFKDAIVILTSNVGSAEMARLGDQNRAGFRTASDATPDKKSFVSAAKKALGNKFRPEFVARIDDTIVFNKLSDGQYGEILERYVETANERYQKLGVMLTLTPDLRDELVASCDDRHRLGARPVLRQYEKLVESLLADHVSTGGIPEGNNVYALLSNDYDDITNPGAIEMYYRANSELIPERPLFLPPAYDGDHEVETAAPTALAIGVQAASLAITTGSYVHSKFKSLRAELKNRQTDRHSH